MRFEQIRYLEWARQRFDEAPPKYNLAASGLISASAAEAGIDPSALRLNGGTSNVVPRLAKLYGVSPDRVLAAAGTSGANFVVQAALLRPGDTALCEWPAYEPLWRTLEDLGARVEWIRRAPERGYQPDLGAIADGFARGARLLMLSDLHNPSATLLPRETVREIGRIARRHDAWVIVDEVYLSSVFDQPVESGCHLGERIIITASLTKTYGLGGLRAGWAIAPPEIVRSGQSILGHLVGAPPVIAEDAAAQALENLPRLKARAEGCRAQNWPLVHAFARERKLLACEPAGAFIAWLKLPKGLDADVLVDHMSTKYETLVVPGTFFGMSDHIRVGFGQKTEMIREGLDRLGRALNDLTG